MGFGFGSSLDLDGCGLVSVLGLGFEGLVQILVWVLLGLLEVVSLKLGCGFGLWGTRIWVLVLYIKLIECIRLTNHICCLGHLGVLQEELESVTVDSAVWTDSHVVDGKWSKCIYTVHTVYMGYL